MQYLIIFGFVGFAGVLSKLLNLGWVTALILAAILCVGALYLLIEVLTIAEHTKAKKDPLSALRKKAMDKKNTAIALGDEFKIPTKMKGVVYAMRQKKVRNKEEHPKRDKNFDYYEGNAMKIGFTTKDVDIRALQLQEEYGNRIFDPCIICEVNHVYEVEQKTHELLANKELWREMFDISPNEAEKAIKDAVKELKGAKILNFEKRASPSEPFSSSGDVQTYSLAMRRKLFSEGKIENDPDHYEEIPF